MRRLRQMRCRHNCLSLDSASCSALLARLQDWHFESLSVGLYAQQLDGGDDEDLQPAARVDE